VYCNAVYSRAKIIFAGKLRNPYFCHIFGMERQFFLLKKGIYQPGPGFEFGLTEKLGRCKKS
jgi:hypothetical protein